jgi:hypothetical protein
LAVIDGYSLGIYTLRNLPAIAASFCQTDSVTLGQAGRALVAVIDVLYNTANGGNSDPASGHEQPRAMGPFIQCSYTASDYV